MSFFLCLKKRRFYSIPINVSLNSNVMSQSAQADEKRHSFDCHFPHIVQDHFPSVNCHFPPIVQDHFPTVNSCPWEVGARLTVHKGMREKRSGKSFKQASAGHSHAFVRSYDSSHFGFRLFLLTTVGGAFSLPVTG